MSYNIGSIDTLKSTLRISRENAEKARELELPEHNPLDDLSFSKDGFAKIDRFAWGSTGSGNTYRDSLRDFVALTEGDADLVLTWEDGDSHSGLRIRNGQMKECEVTMTLAPDKSGLPAWT